MIGGRVSQSVRDTFQRAIALHHQGVLTQAQELYESVLTEAPDQPDVSYLLGTLHLQQGRFAEAIQHLERAVKSLRPSPDMLNNLGIAYKAVSRNEDALKAFQKAISADEKYPQAYFNLGQLFEQHGQLNDAELCYRKAVELAPGDLESQTSFARLLTQLEKWPEAERVWRACLERTPNDLDTLISLGFILTKQEKHHEAEEIYHSVLRYKPDYYQVINNLSFLSERQGKIQEAIDYAKQSAEVQPEFADAWNNLGIAYRSAHRLEDAQQAFRQALELQAEFPLAKFNLATTHMLEGDYPSGWLGYEQRFQLGAGGSSPSSKPLWSGESISDKTLLVYADQGFGDAIQFARFLPRIIEQSNATKILFRCPPSLVTLYSECLQFASDSHREKFVVIAEDNAVPEHDYQFPLLSCGLLWNLDITEVESDAYISVDPHQVSTIDQILPATHSAGKPRIGLCWQGNPAQARDIVRSMPFEKLQPIVADQRIDFVSLQVMPNGMTSPLETVDWAANIVDVGSHVQNFAETALAISRLDAIITVDTAVAHLAGAMGANVMTMVCHTPDWRWHLDRSECPWYSTMKLARQQTWGDWSSVVTQAQEFLESLIAEE